MNTSEGGNVPHTFYFAMGKCVGAQGGFFFPKAKLHVAPIAALQLKPGEAEEKPLKTPNCVCNHKMVNAITL